jgi:hypothetical protein
MSATHDTRDLNPATLALPVRGQHLGHARTLGELVREPTLLAFLRHCG